MAASIPALVPVSQKQPRELKKIAIFTDIHFGRRGNSRVHNQDCLDFISWFCEQVKKDKKITHVAFLGDWFESRSAINIETLEFSYRGLQMLNELGFPVFFIVGNHDLHRRTTRDVHSVRMFNELSNFTVIDKPTVVDNVLFSPFLFEDEYPALVQYNDLWAFLGHFEFKDFVITGHNQTLDHGPDHKMFPGPKRILSGHFHKRQHADNVFYVGNSFPMDFGDAGDYKRGMCLFEVLENKVNFIDWPDSPKYYKTLLSKVIEEKWNPLPKMKVKCIIDTEISYKDAQELREALISAYQLRDFILEEDREAQQELLEGENVEVDEKMLEFDNVDDLVAKQIELLSNDPKNTMDVNLLVSIYRNLPVELEEDDD